jgi:hypothetical protein
MTITTTLIKEKMNAFLAMTIFMTGILIAAFSVFAFFAFLTLGQWFFTVVMVGGFVAGILLSRWAMVP